MNTRIRTLSTLSLVIALGACADTVDSEEIVSIQPDWNEQLDEPGSDQDEPIDGPVLEDPVDDPIVDPVEDPIVDPVEDPTEDPILPTAPLAECEMTELWWNEDTISRWTPARFSMSPDNTMLLTGAMGYSELSGIHAMRVASGELIYTGYQSSLVMASNDWSRTLEVAYDYADGTQHLAVRDTDSGAILTRVPSDYSSHAKLSGDGSTLVTGRCAAPSSDPSNTSYTLSFWDVESDTLIGDHDLGAVGCGWVNLSMGLSVSDDGRVVALTDTLDRDFGDDPSAPILRRIERTGDEVSITTTPIPLLDDELAGQRYYGKISSLGIHGDHIEVTDARGLHTIFDADLKQVAQETRGAFVSNPDTYMPPYPSSPWARSADGRVSAVTALDGSVELRLDGERVGSIVAPTESDISQWSGEDAIWNQPVAITFSPDEDMVAVSFRKGIGVWGCAGSLPSGDSMLESVSLDAPATVNQNELIELDVDLRGQAQGHVVFYHLLVNDSHHLTVTDPSELVWRVGASATATTRTISVVVDDSFGSVQSAEYTVRVEP